eukprot:6060864-Pleurochrysis_carterae.AAC.2
MKIKGLKAKFKAEAKAEAEIFDVDGEDPDWQAPWACPLGAVILVKAPGYPYWPAQASDAAAHCRFGDLLLSSASQAVLLTSYASAPALARSRALAYSLARSLSVRPAEKFHSLLAAGPFALSLESRL